MLNVKQTVNGNKLTIEVDLSQDHGRSTTGRSNIVATTKGFAAVPDRPGMILSLNVCKK